MIKAECIAASQCQTKIATFKVTMPRYILAEFNTHRAFSRNSASSRAITAKKMINSVTEDTFIPIAWQKEHTGMQGTEYFSEDEILTGFDVSNLWKSEMTANEMWKHASQGAIAWSNTLRTAHVTKQLSNRLLEPFMYHTVLVTATEWENFFELRCPKYHWYWDHSESPSIYKSKKELIAAGAPYLKDQLDNPLYWLSINKGQADIHMMAVAEAIYDAWNEAEFKELKPGEWHIPYGDSIYNEHLDEAIYRLNPENKMLQTLPPNLTFNEATRNRYRVMISIARCARLSYQSLGDDPKIDYVADIEMYMKLFKNKHWSPFEHVACAMSPDEWVNCMKTIINKDGLFENQHGWLANFRGWVQQRAMLENIA